MRIIMNLPYLKGMRFHLKRSLWEPSIISESINSCYDDISDNGNKKS